MSRVDAVRHLAFLPACLTCASLISGNSQGADWCLWNSMSLQPDVELLEPYGDKGSGLLGGLDGSRSTVKCLSPSRLRSNVRTGRQRDANELIATFFFFFERGKQNVVFPSPRGVTV
jgi:hypothetical protein